MIDDQPELALPPHGRAPAQTVENRMPCRWCGTQTLIATLNHYGARCQPCYDAWCEERQAWPDVGNRKVEPLSWAYALRRRDEQGDRLTQAQRDAWRVAVRWVQVEASKREDATTTHAHGDPA